MTEVKNMETMIATENQQEATEVMAFLGELEPQEKKDFLVFMQGIRFAKGIGHGKNKNTGAARKAVRVYFRYCFIQHGD